MTSEQIANEVYAYFQQLCADLDNETFWDACDDLSTKLFAASEERYEQMPFLPEDDDLDLQAPKRPVRSVSAVRGQSLTPPLFQLDPEDE